MNMTIADAIEEAKFHREDTKTSCGPRRGDHDWAYAGARVAGGGCIDGNGMVVSTYRCRRCALVLAESRRGIRYSWLPDFAG